MFEFNTGYLPFERDIEKIGAYQYTDGSRLSARVANARYTEMILSCADFKGKSVVDVGSGDGTYTAELARFSGAASILGVEPSLKASERARSTYHGSFSHLIFLCGNTETLLQRAERFDIAVYRGVVHHVIDPRMEIQRGIALARSLIILEPNGLNPFMKLAEKLSSYHRQHGERSFTPYTLSRWIREGDGKVEKIRFFGLVPYFCPDLIVRIGRRLEPLAESIPWIRALYSGQYIIVASQGRNRANPAHQ